SPLPIHRPPALTYTRSLHDALPILADSLDEGVTVRSEIAKKIREKTLGAVGRRRSRMIARTEIANAGNEGKKRSAQDWSEESGQDRKSTRLNSSHVSISYAVFCLKK